jgi:hypothetical protein
MIDKIHDVGVVRRQHHRHAGSVNQLPEYTDDLVPHPAVQLRGRLIRGAVTAALPLPNTRLMPAASSIVSLPADLSFSTAADIAIPPRYLPECAYILACGTYTVRRLIYNKTLTVSEKGNNLPMLLQLPVGL